MNAASPLPDSYDLCIIGAGVSGLCLATAASRLGLRTLVLERRPEAGGCLGSVPVGSGAAPGWLELGAHTCYNSYLGFLDAMAGTELLARAVPRKGLGFRMLRGGLLRSIPACLDYLELVRCLPRAFWTAKADRTTEAYYGRILGPRNWDRVLHPMLNAVASQETAGFPADALFHQRNGRRKDVLRSFAVRGGLGPAVQALAALPGIHCVLDREAVAVTRSSPDGPTSEPDSAGFTVRTDQGESFQARHLALATPAPEAARLLGPDWPGIAGLLARIQTRRVQTLGVVFQDPQAHLPRLTGLVLPDSPCFSAVSADTFPVPGQRAWSLHFDGGRGLDDEAMLDCACRLLGTPRSAVTARFRRDHALPAVALGHARWLQELDRSLAGTGLMVVGNYLSGLSIEDCAGRAQREGQRVLRPR